MAAILAAAQLVGSGVLLEETLPVAARRPFNGPVNPLECARLFSTAPTLSLTCGMLVLQWLVEPKNLADVFTLVAMNQVKLSEPSLAALTSAFGLGIFLSGPLTEWSISRLGASMHTTATQLASSVVFAARGVSPTESTFWGMLPLTYYGETRLATTKALATNIAVANGLGKGEFGGLQANLRAFVTAIAPSLYGVLYRTGVAAGSPGRPYLAAALAMLVAEAIHRRLRATHVAPAGKP